MTLTQGVDMNKTIAALTIAAFFCAPGARASDVCFTREQALKVSKTLKACKGDKKKHKVELKALKAQCKLKVQGARQDCRKPPAVHPAVWFLAGAVVTGVAVGVIVWQVSVLDRP